MILWVLGFVIVAGLLMLYAKRYKKVYSAEVTKTISADEKLKLVTVKQYTPAKSTSQKVTSVDPLVQRHRLILTWVNVLLLLVVGLTYLTSTFSVDHSIQFVVDLLALYIGAWLFVTILWLELLWKVYQGPPSAIRFWLALLAIRVLGAWVFFSLISQWLGPNPGPGFVVVIIPMYILLMLLLALPIQLIIMLIKTRHQKLWGKTL